MLFQNISWLSILAPTSISCLVYHINPCKLKTLESVFNLKNVFLKIGDQDLSSILEFYSI